MNEESDEEIHSVKFRRVLNTGALYPWNWGALTLRQVDVFTNSKAL